MSFKDDWHRHSIAVPSVTRTIHRIKKADDWTPKNKKGVYVTYNELVHQHDVYRQKLDAKKVSPVLWHRGARVGTV